MAYGGDALSTFALESHWADLVLSYILVSSSLVNTVQMLAFSYLIERFNWIQLEDLATGGTVARSRRMRLFAWVLIVCMMISMLAMLILLCLSEGNWLWALLGVGLIVFWTSTYFCIRSFCSKANNRLYDRMQRSRNSSARSDAALIEDDDFSFANTAKRHQQNNNNPPGHFQTLDIPETMSSQDSFSKVSMRQENDHPIHHHHNHHSHHANINSTGNSQTSFSSPQASSKKIINNDSTTTATTNENDEVHSPPPSSSENNNNNNNEQSQSPNASFQNLGLTVEQLAKMVEDQNSIVAEFNRFEFESSQMSHYVYDVKKKKKMKNLIEIIFFFFNILKNRMQENHTICLKIDIVTFWRQIIVEFRFHQFQMLSEVTILMQIGFLDF